jgi:L-seryl-tRNA(Ser) seleniumtransferase
MKNPRAIPAVGKILDALEPLTLPTALVTTLVRRHLASLRQGDHVPGFETIIRDLRTVCSDLALSKLQPVINGTGIVIHTNLGRAPLGAAVVNSLGEIAQNYSNLEFDLASGERRSRGAYLEHNLALLCGADAATVVNNCAAALVLILRHFTKKKREVIISRGELVQIGGGFRIPDILEASGAQLREIGTTNKTSLEDYAGAIGSDTAMILKVHRSNFFMSGFVESVDTAALAKLARTKRIPLVEDLGSGAIVATEKWAGIEHEPTPAEVLKRGVDLVCFSADKLLGGPQAGVIAGKNRHVTVLKREPFFRALRCDKLILAALQTTVDYYLSGAADDAVPILVMMRQSSDELRARAEKMVALLRDLPTPPTIGADKSQLGGGTLPSSAIPSITLDFSVSNLDEFAARLRRGTPPVIGYRAGGNFKLDLRTIFSSRDERLVQAIRAAASAT